MFWSRRTLRGGIAPALVWTRQLASLTLGDVRNAGFASEVRIAATRHLPAAGVRSRIGPDVRSAPGTGRVSRATAGGLARAGPGSGLAGFFNDTATTEIYTLSLHDAGEPDPWNLDAPARPRTP